MQNMMKGRMTKRAHDAREASAARKRHIAQSVRMDVWTHYCGRVYDAKCLCCGHADVSVREFECGHVLAEAKGGQETIDNLRPICGPCNRSMGTQDMREFMRSHGYKQAANWEGFKSKGSSCVIL